MHDANSIFFITATPHPPRREGSNRARAAIFRVSYTQGNRQLSISAALGSGTRRRIGFSVAETLGRLFAL